MIVDIPWPPLQHRRKELLPWRYVAEMGTASGVARIGDPQDQDEKAIGHF